MATALTPESILNRLDANQQRACLALHGPVRIYAGAGTGKTRTIVHRIAYGCAVGAWTNRELLAVTFTAKAAAEMRERLTTLGVESPNVRTFHSRALADLHYYWPLAFGLNVEQRKKLPKLVPNYDSFLAQAIHHVQRQHQLTILNGMIYDGPAQTTALRRSHDLNSLSQNDPNARVSRVVLDALFEEISWAKVSLIDHQNYVDQTQKIGHQPPQGISRSTFAQIYTFYETYKFQESVMDFNDILLLNCHLINQYDQVREAVRRRYRYITVDEFQDVSPLQQLLLDLWLGPNQNLCVVGDPNQTIYSFAGASPRYLLNFTRKYPQATTLELDINYRSTPSIIALANEIVKDSPGTIVLKSTLSKGPKLSFETFDSDREEARGVAEAIQNLSAIDPDQTAILVRTHFSIGPILAALRAVGLKAHNRSAEFEANRGLMRDADMLGKVADLPSDPELAVQKLAELGYAPPSFPKGSLTDLIGRVISSYPDLNSANQDPGAAPPNPQPWSSRAILESEFVPYTPTPPGLIPPPGLTTHAPVSSTTSAPPNVAPHTGAEPPWEVLEPEPELTPLSSESAPGGVTVMTIHSAKGLEFKNVFLMGLFEGGVPYFEANSQEAIAEERRLFYVAITRAKSRLFLSYALSKHGNSKRPRKRSTFLDRLWPQKH